MRPFLAIFRGFTFVWRNFAERNLPLFEGSFIVCKISRTGIWRTHINGYFCNCNFASYVLFMPWYAQIANHYRENRFGCLGMRLMYGEHFIHGRPGFLLCISICIFILYIIYMYVRVSVCVCVCACMCVCVGGCLGGWVCVYMVITNNWTKYF